MNRWYDADCKALHSQLRHSFSHDHHFYASLKASDCCLLRHKKHIFISQRRHDLRAYLIHSPKSFWCTIFPCHSLLIDLDPGSMFSHISSLYDVLGQTLIRDCSPPISCYLFSYQDIQEAVWVMNTSKATNEEGFQLEFFEHVLHALDNHLAYLFNHVVRIGFSQAWSHHTIHSIHKSGPSVDPNNYRTIMVVHTFSKLYALVLHIKLSRDLKGRLLRVRGQAGFRPAHQTTNHILTLWVCYAL